MSDRVNDFIEEKTGVDLGVSDRDVANGIMTASGAGAVVLSGLLARDYYNAYRYRQEVLNRHAGEAGALSIDDPRERMSNQLLMRGHASMDEILRASFGEWPPNGLEIVTENPQTVTFGDIAERFAEIQDDHMTTWADASLVNERRIRVNHEELSERLGRIRQSAYSSTLGHEGVHILQGDNYNRALEIYGHNNAFRIWNEQQMILGNNDVVARVFGSHANAEYTSGLNENSLKHHDYLRSGIETQARIHEVLTGGYQEWGRLPTSREEFLVAMKNSGLDVPDEIMDQIRNSPTFEEANRVFFVQDSSRQGAVRDLNNMQQGLTQEGRVALWDDAMPAVYADWLEMVGDGPGRARMGMGVNIRPELRAQINPEQPPKPPPTQWIYDHSDNPDLREAVERLVEEQHYDARIRFLARGGEPNDFRFDKEGKINGLINQYKGVQCPSSNDLRQMVGL